MPNNDTTAARSFHDATKLSYISLSTSRPCTRLQRPAPQWRSRRPPSPEMPALEAVGGPPAASSGPLDLNALAQLLHYSAGLIRRSFLRSAGEVHYRAAASAGALYPIELYVVCADLPGLNAGIYHYGPSENALTLLRQGDHRGNWLRLRGASRRPDAAGTIVCSCVFCAAPWSNPSAATAPANWTTEPSSPTCRYATPWANRLRLSPVSSTPMSMVCSAWSPAARHHSSSCPSVLETRLRPPSASSRQHPPERWATSVARSTRRRGLYTKALVWLTRRKCGTGGHLRLQENTSHPATTSLDPSRLAKP